MKIIPVILSGGVGARLWPLSRQTFPKPFVALPHGDTLIRKAYARAAGLGNTGHVVTVTNRDLAGMTVDEYRSTGIAGVRNTLLLEPVSRDTAAAIGLAALHIADIEGDDAIVVTLPADHLISDEEALKTAVGRAAALAGNGRIVAFGIRPTSAETGYGYIEAEGDAVRRFVEKPDLATATAFAASGNHYWNAGIFCFAAATMIEAMEQFCPHVLASTRTALADAVRVNGTASLSVKVDAAAFAAVPSVSIDRAVMEKTTNLALVPCDCGWSDVGNWAAVSGLAEPDEHGNRAVGDTVLEGSADCFVSARDRLVALVGVRDLVVVDTPDALLVADRRSTQDVKLVYDRLRDAGHPAARLNRTVHRPWGSYTVLEEGNRFKIKRIEVRPGASLSLQAHHHRSEHWVVVGGSALVAKGNSDMLLTTDQSTYIPCGHRHRLSNPGRIPLVMIEVQSGDYLGEDDIVRFEDDYGRA